MSSKEYMTMGHHGFPAQPDDQPSGKGRCGCSDPRPYTVISEADGIASVPSASAKPVNHQLGIPFVVQAGSALFMLASDATVWTLAELRFDAETCTFVEASRVRYDWPREAFGSMLSRVALSGEIEPELINRITTDFSTWLAQQFVGSIPE